VTWLSRLRALTADAGVRATALARLVALAGAPVTLWLAATRVPVALQGYYFVAVNVIALAQLFELGLGTIVVQFASHEWPLLRWGKQGGIEGDPASRDRISALLRAAIRWYGRAGLALFVVAGVGGVMIFRNPFIGSPLAFAILWMGLVAMTGLYLLLVPFLCVAEGCGDLLSVQRMRAVQALAILVTLWLGLLFTGALMAVWLAAMAQLAVAVGWLVRRHAGLIRAPKSLPAHLMLEQAGLPARFRLEQRRSAQLWLALYLMPQLLAPVLLRAKGGDAAGRLGVTLAIAIAPLTLAVAWLHGRYPSFGALVAEGETQAFDTLARRAAGEAALIFAGGAVAVTGVVIALPFLVPMLAVRVLPLPALLGLLGGSLASLLLQAMAGWLRAFRDEEIATPIVGGAAAVVIASATASVLGGPNLTAVTFGLTSLVIAVPIAYVHFRRVRALRLRPVQTS
jgi:hypothetical protein